MVPLRLGHQDTLPGTVVRGNKVCYVSTAWEEFIKLLFWHVLPIPSMGSGVLGRRLSPARMTWDQEK